MSSGSRLPFGAIINPTTPFVKLFVQQRLCQTEAGNEGVYRVRLFQALGQMKQTERSSGQVIYWEIKRSNLCQPINTKSWTPGRVCCNSCGFKQLSCPRVVELLENRMGPGQPSPFQWPCISSISSRFFTLSNPSLIKKRILCLSSHSRFFSISRLIVCPSSAATCNHMWGHHQNIMIQTRTPSISRIMRNRTIMQQRVTFRNSSTLTMGRYSSESSHEI